MHLNQQKKDNFVLKSNHEYDNLMREYNYLTNELQQRYDKTIDEYNGKECKKNRCWEFTILI